VTLLGWIGVWLLVAGAVAIVVEGVLALVWGVGLARRTRALSQQMETERGRIEADLQRLREAVDETTRLWRPYERALRWLRHPLTIALLESFARRRSAAR
jgi:hypothetical protein